MPQVVGAAASRSLRDPDPPDPHLAGSEGGGTLPRGDRPRTPRTRDDEVELAEQAPRSRRRAHRPRRRWSLVVVAVLAAGGYAAWAWSQRQFYVAAEAGSVAIFRGVSQDLGPIGLSRVESQSDVTVSDLPVDVQGSVERTIPAR